MVKDRPTGASRVTVSLLNRSAAQAEMAPKIYQDITWKPGNGNRQQQSHLANLSLRSPVCCFVEYHHGDITSCRGARTAQSHQTD